MVQSLEESGFSSLEELARAQMVDVTGLGATILGLSCWKISVQACAAIDDAMHATRQTTGIVITPEIG